MLQSVVAGELTYAECQQLLGHYGIEPQLEKVSERRVNLPKTSERPALPGLNYLFRNQRQETSC